MQGVGQKRLCRQSPEINSELSQYFPITGKRILCRSINSSGKQKEKLTIWKPNIKYLIPSSRDICTIPSQFQYKLLLPLWDSEWNGAVLAHIREPHSVSGRHGLEGLLRPSTGEETGVLSQRSSFCSFCELSLYSAKAVETLLWTWSSFEACSPGNSWGLLGPWWEG